MYFLLCMKFWYYSTLYQDWHKYFHYHFYYKSQHYNMYKPCLLGIEHFPSMLTWKCMYLDLLGFALKIHFPSRSKYFHVSTWKMLDSKLTRLVVQVTQGNWLETMDQLGKANLGMEIIIAILAALGNIVVLITLARNQHLWVRFFNIFLFFKLKCLHMV